MRCEDAIQLIGGAAEGRVAPGTLDTLMAHLEACPSCRREAETQVVVKRVLASRPNESVSPELMRKIAARIDAAVKDTSRAVAAWRRWWKKTPLPRV